MCLIMKENSLNVEIIVIYKLKNQLHFCSIL